MNEQERFDQICNPALGRIESKIDELTIVIRGNGKTGIAENQSRQDERIKVLESGAKWLWGVITTISCSMILYALISAVKVIAQHQVAQMP